MTIRVTGITGRGDVPSVAGVLAACAAAFDFDLPDTSDTHVPIDGTRIALAGELPLCVDALLRCGRQLLSVTHDGAGEWSARLLTVPDT